jgi:hypothetical protein
MGKKELGIEKYHRLIKKLPLRDQWEFIIEWEKNKKLKNGNKN